MRIKKQTEGFTLIELLVVIAIIAILASVILIVINPIEINRKTRDALRLSDLASLQQAIIAATQDHKKTVQELLCFGVTPPCQGSSFPQSSTTRNSNGTGWVMVNFKDSGFLSYPVLPIDPANNAFYHYTYYSDGTEWEINTTLESDTYKSKMRIDGGDNDSKYEVGTNLKIAN